MHFDPGQALPYGYRKRGTIIVEFVRPVTPEERGRYYAAVAEAIDRCSQMPFTEQMGGAVAGRVFRVNFIDARNRKQAEVPWLRKKS